MAIQFHCPGCSQPIEVDDVHGGQTAACPYCRRVINVPIESALDRSSPAAARPAPGAADPEDTPEFNSPESDDSGASPPPPPQPGLGELHVGPRLAPRERAATTLGNYALVCTALAVVLFVGVFVYGISQIAPEVLANPGSQPSPERMAELQSQLGADPWMAAAQIGVAFFALVGTALAVTSLVQGRRGNWRAIVSVVICGMFVLCVCGGVVLGVLAGGGLPA